MSQNTSVESSSRSSSNPVINPVLQAALSSLDVQLEEELARYRWKNAGRPVRQSRGLGRHQSRKPLDLIALEKPAKKRQPPALGMSTAPEVSFPLPNINSTPAPPSRTSHEPRGQTDQLHDLASTPSAAPPLVASSTNPVAENSGTQDVGVPTPFIPPDSQTDAGGGLVPTSPEQGQPEDYLESSEQLLRSLEEDETPKPPPNRLANRLLNPLNVGLVLLLVLSSATIAYILTNPSTLSALGLNRLFGSETPTTAQNPTPSNINAPTPTAPAVEGPDLASEEFVDLNLNTLSHLETSPLPIPSPSPVPPVPDLPNPQVNSEPPAIVPNTALPNRSTNLPSALLAPNQQGRAVVPTLAPPVTSAPPAASVPASKAPNSTSAKPSPSPEAATPTTITPPNASSLTAPTQAATNPAPVQDSFYYVLTNYQGDGSLEQAKTMVPDAYVRNFPEGTRIQMGAFKLESEAKSLVEQLQQQGISASIYRP